MPFFLLAYNMQKHPTSLYAYTESGQHTDNQQHSLKEDLFFTVSKINSDVSLRQKKVDELRVTKPVSQSFSMSCIDKLLSIISLSALGLKPK